MKMRLSPRLSLIIITALFVLPLLLAWFMYTGTIEYRPGSTRNLGQLVEPPQPISWESIEIISSIGVTAGDAVDDLAEHWVILQPLPAGCDVACIEQVTSLRQIHRAAGRNQSRVRIALLPEAAEATTLARLQNTYDEFRIIRSKDDALQAAMARSTDDDMATYLIDPLGNIMMVYATGADPNHLKTDLKRLLTWSKLDE